MKNDVDRTFSKFQNYLMADAVEQYSDTVITLAYEPVNLGEMENPDGVGFVKGSCGDRMLIFLRVTDGKISDAKFLTDGCGVIHACGSAVTELVKGKTAYEAAKTYPQEVIKYLDGLPASHLHCSVLVIQTLQKALENLKMSVDKKRCS